MFSYILNNCGGGSRIQLQLGGPRTVGGTLDIRNTTSYEPTQQLGSIIANEKDPDCDRMGLDANTSTSILTFMAANITKNKNGTAPNVRYSLQGNTATGGCRKKYLFCELEFSTGYFCLQ